MWFSRVTSEACIPGGADPLPCYVSSRSDGMWKAGVKPEGGYLCSCIEVIHKPSAPVKTLRAPQTPLCVKEALGGLTSISIQRFSSPDGTIHESPLLRRNADIPPNFRGGCSEPSAVGAGVHHAPALPAFSQFSLYSHSETFPPSKMFTTHFRQKGPFSTITIHRKVYHLFHKFQG